MERLGIGRPDAQQGPGNFAAAAQAFRKALSRAEAANSERADAGRNLCPSAYAEAGQYSESEHDYRRAVAPAEKRGPAISVGHRLMTSLPCAQITISARGGRPRFHWASVVRNIGTQYLWHYFERYCHVGRLRRDVMLDECWTACTVAIGSRERSSRIPSGSTSASE